MPSLLTLLLVELFASFATTTSNIDTSLQLGPR